MPERLISIVFEVSLVKLIYYVGRQIDQITQSNGQEFKNNYFTINQFKKP